MSRMSGRWREAGDTIVEVLVSTVVISVVIAGAYRATNNGLRIGQNAIERTQASELLSAQAEVLRTMRDLRSSGSNWNAVTAKVTTALPTGDVCATNNGTPTAGSQPFWLNTATDPLTITNAPNTVGYFKYWVEAYRPSASDTYIDFYIHGCWPALGESVPQNSSIVVRLETT